jgi:putative transcriptional regulator
MLRCTIWIGLLLVCALWQPATAQTPGRGTLLISTDSLAGTMFEETVVLVVHHDDDGSIGIMINRPTNLQPSAVFPDIAGAASYTGVLYFGGPLAPTRPYLLARQSDSVAETGIRIVDDVYLSGDPSVLGSFSEPRRSNPFSRIYAGNAQWGPGQLQSEVNAGAWRVLPASAGTIFSAEPEELWSRLKSAPGGGDIVQSIPAQTRDVRVRLAFDR